MVMRELNEDERGAIEKNMPGLRAEAKHLAWLKKYNDLMLDEGLENNYLEKVREYKKNGKNIKDEIKIMVEKIEVLKKQLSEGVEVKKAPVGVN